MPEPTSTSAPLWHDALTRRLRSLLRTGPLHRLRESRAEVLLEHDDPAALCMRALEVLVDSLGLRPGASRDEVHAALSPLLRANDLAHEVVPNDARHAGVCELVIGALLNDAGRRQAYSTAYLDFVDGRPVTRVLRFRLASEQETLSGAIVLRAEADGINLFLRSLDVPLEDVQAATEAVIRSQLDRGRLDLALQSAREAQVRSVQYHAHVDGLLRKTQRDLGKVDWRHEVPALIQEALGHIQSRMDTERQLIETVEERIDALAGRPEAIALVRIREMLEDCQRRHLALHLPLMKARETFLEEQARQRFAPIPIRGLPSLEPELLVPLLGANSALARSAGEAFQDALLPAMAPPLLNLEPLWDRLLRPARRVQHTGPETTPELTAIEAPPPRFDDAVVAEVESLLQQLEAPTPLTRVLALLEQPPSAQYAVLRCLQQFAPASVQQQGPVDVATTNSSLDDPRFEGDELMLSPEPRDVP